MPLCRVVGGNVILSEIWQIFSLNKYIFWSLTFNIYILKKKRVQVSKHVEDKKFKLKTF